MQILESIFARRSVKLAFHDADNDFLARIFADTFDTRDVLATILARMSVRMSV